MKRYFIISPIIADFWAKGYLSLELKEGTVINFLKGGDQLECKNWQGIMLLSMVNKVQ